MPPIQLRHTETKNKLKRESSNMDVAAKIFQIIPRSHLCRPYSGKTWCAKSSARWSHIAGREAQSRCGNVEPNIVNQFAMYIIACVSVFHEFLWFVCWTCQASIQLSIGGGDPIVNVCRDTDVQLLFSLEGAHGVNGMLVYARLLSPYDYTVYVWWRVSHHCLFCWNCPNL